LPNATKYANRLHGSKDSTEQNKTSVLGKNILDYTDGNGLHFITFYFVIGLQDRTSKNQNFHSAEMFRLLVIICSF